MRYSVTVMIPALILAGCGGGSGHEVTRGKTLDAILAEKDREDAARRARAEALKADRGAIAREAVDAMRKAAAESFGTAESEAAAITADPSGIRDFGGEKWEVAGRYRGPDKDGKEFEAPFTADIRFLFDELQCLGIELGDRRYRE